MPIPLRSEVPLAERVNQLQRLAAEAGRGPIPVTVYGTLPRAEVINHYAEIGVERCVFWLPTAPAPEALPHLDRYAELAASIARAGA